MEPVSLLLFSRQNALAILDHLRSGVINGTHVATVVLQNDPPVIWCDPWSIEDGLFVSIMLLCPNLRTLHLVECPFDTIAPGQVQQLATGGALSRLYELRIGSPGLKEETLFLLLSATPTLKVLHLGLVYSDSHSQSGYDPGSWPQPACRLTSLSVAEESDDFKHYELLLANSHNTLTEFCLEQISDPSILSNICRALSLCSQVRSLKITGVAGLEGVTASCPRVRSLAFSVPLGPAQLGAIRAPTGVRELRVAPSIEANREFNGVLDDMLEWTVSVRSLPSLRALAFPIPPSARSYRSYTAYQQLRSLCSDRCIRITTLNRGYRT